MNNSDQKSATGVELAPESEQVTLLREYLDWFARFDRATSGPYQPTIWSMAAELERKARRVVMERDIEVERRENTNRLIGIDTVTGFANFATAEVIPAILSDGALMKKIKTRRTRKRAPLTWYEMKISVVDTFGNNLNGRPIHRSEVWDVVDWTRVALDVETEISKTNAIAKEGWKKI